MIKTQRKSRDLIEIIADVVKATSADCVIYRTDKLGNTTPDVNPEINYIFGNARYVKDRLSELSKTPTGTVRKFPLIALFCPVNEKRVTKDYFATTKVRVLIACSTRQQLSNEQRLETSFRKILRPIYNRFIEALKEDGRFDFGYDEVVPHEYSENYSYGRYGAHTAAGEEVSEPIDAINITNLELKITNQNCR